jgi:hypothetical protein
LATPEADPKKIIKKGKTCQESFSVVLSGTSRQFLDSTLNTPVVISSIPPLPSTEVSNNLDFENFLVEYSSFDPELKEEILKSLPLLIL